MLTLALILPMVTVSSAQEYWDGTNTHKMRLSPRTHVDLVNLKLYLLGWEDDLTLMCLYQHDQDESTWEVTFLKESAWDGNAPYCEHRGWVDDIQVLRMEKNGGWEAWLNYTETGPQFMSIDTARKNIHNDNDYFINLGESDRNDKRRLAKRTAETQGIPRCR